MIFKDSLWTARLVAIAMVTLLALASCGGDDSTVASATEPTAASEPTAVVTTAPAPTVESTVDATSAPVATAVPASAAATGQCEEVAALFVTRGSANADLDDPQVAASCEGDSIVITSNGIPDYTYIGTSPGFPTDRDHTFTIPANPTVAESVTDVPALGTAAVTLGGIPIFGPTEGTGGDVDSLPGILSDCGSHNGPSGFHIHKIMASDETDCLFTPEEVAVGPQLVGYALDGFPIYTGIDQYQSSWVLTDESLFASDTWAAHSYVEGSGDLDQCNGLTDADGNYAYYTTATFPYVIGCYVGAVEIVGPGGGDRPERPAAADGAEGAEGADGAAPAATDGEERPERPDPPEGEAPADGEARPERPDPPEGEAPADGEERPERPEPPEGEAPAGGEERPERPAPPDAEEDDDQP